MTLRSKFLMLTGLIAGTLVAASPAFASGTVSGAGGADAYARGKAVFARKVTCADCPLASGVETPEAAKSALARIDAGEFGLDDGERKAVKEFMNRRFKLA